jgi:hypothetical protein
VRAGLVQRPEQWEWSTYPGYRDAGRAQARVADDELLTAWQGDQGGRDARSAYIAFRGAGLGQSAPTAVSRRLWRVGSGFRAIPGSTAKPRPFDPVRYPPVAEARQLTGIDPNRIFAAVRSYYGLDDAPLSRRHDPHVARGVAAWLCRRHTEASLRELAL